MTFQKSKLIDNRPSWHPLRLCVKFGSQGDQIGTENLFQPSMQTGSFVVILAIVGRICADLGPDCSLFVKSTKFSGMTELIMTINM